MPEDEMRAVVSHDVRARSSLSLTRVGNNKCKMQIECFTVTVGLLCISSLGINERMHVCKNKSVNQKKKKKKRLE